mmetsp:Transcript_10188/g.41471  ORF Transcript_10188/g.41471 Transcript_10188/m.41471 type:complete len:207 (-) Transcript_10188:1362-1982(-)
MTYCIPIPTHTHTHTHTHPPLSISRARPSCCHSSLGSFLSVEEQLGTQFAHDWVDRVVVRLAPLVHLCGVALEAALDDAPDILAAGPVQPSAVLGQAPVVQLVRGLQLVGAPREELMHYVHCPQLLQLWRSADLRHVSEQKWPKRTKRNVWLSKALDLAERAEGELELGHVAGEAELPGVGQGPDEGGLADEEHEDALDELLDLLR